MLSISCQEDIMAVQKFVYYIIIIIINRIGPGKRVNERVAKLKLQYFGHITRGGAGQLALTVLQGIMEGSQHQGKPRRQWIHDIEEWTGCEYLQLKEMAQD